MYKKLIKGIIFILCLFLFTSCASFISLFAPKEHRAAVKKTFKIISKSSGEYFDACEKFIYRDNTIYLPCTLNNVMDTLFFDTGTSLYFVLEEMQDEKIKILSDRRPSDIKSKLFTATSTLTHVYFLPKDSAIICNQVYNRSKKMLGYLSLPCKETISIRFSDTTICLYKKTPYDTDGYSLIKSRFTPTRLFVYLTIDGIEYEFLFDTGFNGGLILPWSSYINHKRESDYLFEGIMFKRALGINVGADSSVYNAEPLKVRWNETDSFRCASVNFTQNMKSTLLGMEIISNYDWIIDVQKKQVWFKPLRSEENPILGETVDFVYSVDVNKQNNLFIKKRRLSANPKYPLNAIIKSVDGIEISNENICYYRKLLNKAENWDEFQIEVVEAE